MKLPNWPTHNGINIIKLGLERMKNLLDRLDNPQNKMKNIFHVAGTNGKGSTTAFLKSILEKNGYTVNRNTSPHLVRFNERIEVNGKEITDDYYNELADECKFIVDKYNIEASYFEIITAIAFMAFARSGADANILEVGLGGRLDASNVIDKSLVSIITSISFDHMNILGDTLDKITMEKIAIAKDNCPMIVSKQPEIVLNTIKNNVKNSPLYFYDENYSYKKLNDKTCIFEGFNKKIETPLPSLLGEHQIINAGTSIAALCCQKSLKITESAIADGIANTFWRARLQNLNDTKLHDYVPKNSDLYLDGAHNEDGARVIRDWLASQKDTKENVLIISMLERKDTKAYINNIKNSFSKIIVISNNQDEHTKYKTIEDFTKEFNEAGCSVYYGCSDILEALKKTKDIGDNLRIVITGSLYFCGDVLALIEGY